MSNNIIIFKKEILNQTTYENLHNGKLIDGVFSIIDKREDQKYFIARDKHGIKKLFYIIKKNRIYASENFLDLYKKTGINKIFSLKPGYSLILGSNQKKIFRKIKYSNLDYKKNFNSNFAKNKILKVLKNIKKLEKTNECNILLSGGLDSTVIAFLSKKVFKKVNAISCVFLNPQDFKIYKKKGVINEDNYKDFTNARSIAKKLKINFFPVILPLASVFLNLKKVMYLIQDWRDFNVHCGVLNYRISKFIEKKKFKYSPIFTGDFMNECFADYENEIVNNKVYYKQLNISTYLRSKFLINGLQSSDRENGIFSKKKLKIYQPYFCLLDNFKAVNKTFFKKNNKYSFMGKILPHELLKLVGKQKKRAQITDNDGGILNYFVRNKIDQKELIKIFSKKFNIKTSWIKKFIIFGKYLEE